ncbi:P27 family phage terminase small subunit [Miniphocaeibacter massiliensis]|uniref:P27 family phage terminase small subunit n=1 Tax=Miniphocaeibacter massiliensis TaxID=2041841 RepID=UPI001A917D30|nr:P27 family phage terminase small subunit [Miniphocaeibacter massiliensis]
MATKKTRLPTIEKLKKDTIKEMEELGIYKTQYNRIIGIYAGLLRQYISFEKQFENSNYQIEEEYTNKAGATNMRKTPLYSAMESLRKDIVTYSDRLGLNPKSLESISAEKKSTSKLDIMLANLG